MADPIRQASTTQVAQVQKTVKKGESTKSTVKSKTTVDEVVQTSTEDIKTNEKEASTAQRIVQVQNAILAQISKSKPDINAFNQLYKELIKLHPEKVQLPGDVIDHYTASSILAKENIRELEVQLEIECTKNADSDTRNYERIVQTCKEMVKWKTTLACYQDFLEFSKTAKKEQPAPPPLPPHEQKVRAENIATLQEQLVSITIGNDGVDKTEKIIQILKELRKQEPDRVPLAGEVVDRYTVERITAKENITQLEKQLDSIRLSDEADKEDKISHVTKERDKWRAVADLYNQFIDQSNKAKEKLPAPPPLPPHEQKVRAENIAYLQEQLISITISNDVDKEVKTAQVLKELRKWEPDRVPLSGKVIDKYTLSTITAKENIAQLEKQLDSIRLGDEADKEEKTAQVTKELDKWRAVANLYNQFISQSNKAKKDNTD